MKNSNIRSFKKNDLQKIFTEFLTKKFSDIQSIPNINKKKFIKNESNKTAKNIEKWMSLTIPPDYRSSILKSLEKRNLDELFQSFNDEIFYGTSSIRAKMTSSQNSSSISRDLEKLSISYMNKNILQGSNTFNPITLLIFGIGLVNFSKKNNYKKIIIGYDNRVQSQLFASLLHDFFHEFKIKSKIFDCICSTPELVFSIKELKCDLGIMITASHNDKRFNGIKVYTKSGSQPTNSEKDKIVKSIGQNSLKNFELISNFIINQQNKINNRLQKSNTKISSNFITSKYVNHLTKSINLNSKSKHNLKNLKIAFSSINGTGYNPAVKLFQKLGIKPTIIHSMVNQDKFFSLFSNNQILEPSNNVIHKKIISEFVKEYGKKKLNSLDAILFTDPDSDRIGLICNVPKSQQSHYGKHRFVTGNEIWGLILQFYLQTFLKDKIKREKFFIVKSFVTSDLLNAISKKFKIKCYEGNVGFSSLNELVKSKWKNNSINLGMFEESNGYAIAGNPKYSRVHSHFLEKDGIFGMLKIIEFLSYIKSKNISLFQILTDTNLDPKIGYYYNFRTQLPESSSFDDALNNLTKFQILNNLKNFSIMVEKLSKSKRPVKILNYKIVKIKKYTSPSKNKFPYEGIRFYLDSSENHITIRSSATESKIRLFLQLKHSCITEQELRLKKISSEKIKNQLITEIKRILINS